MLPPSGVEKTKYAPVSSRDDDENSLSSTYLVTPPPRSWLARCILQPAIPWALTALFATISLFLGMLVDRDASLGSSHGLGTFAKGYATDFGPAKKHIQVEQRLFTSGAAFDAHGDMYIPNQGATLFMGDPALNPEIDTNWDNLTWGRYVIITREEAIEAWGKEYVTDEYWDKKRGGYLAGFDMFHTLHCLNHIRKSLNPSYYGTAAEIGKGKYGGHPQVHQDHCIDHIRQFIMCSGDMTPVPTKYYSGLGRNYVESEMPHTCRNFDRLRDFMVDRFEGGSAVRPVWE